MYRFAVEQTEALALAVDSVNANKTLLNGRTLGFAMRDTCGLLPEVCLSDLARYLVSEDDVTATVVGPLYAVGDSRKKAVATCESIFRRLTKLGDRKYAGRAVFPLLDIPEVESVVFRETLRYVSQSCALQARAAADFLVQSGWQDIVLVTSADNCGVNISREFHRLVNEHYQCNFKNILYYEETPIGSTSQTVGEGTNNFNPMIIRIGASHDFFQDLIALDKPNIVVVVLSSISFAYSVLGEGYYNPNPSVSVPAEQRKNFTFLLGDFWGEPGKVDELYEVITNMTRDSKQVVSLRAHVNGYEKFQQHMADLTSSSWELRRNSFLGQYWSDYFNCSIDADCADGLRLPVSNRPILRNTNALLVVDAVYASVGYIQQFTAKYPTAKDVVFSAYSLGQLNVTSWTGNVIHLNQIYPHSYIQVLEWKYSVLILKLGKDGRHLDAELYGQWIWYKGKPDNLTVNSNISKKLWRPKKILPSELCPSSSALPTAFLANERVCSPDDAKPLVVLPSLIIVLICIMGTMYGLMKGWMKVWESILQLISMILIVVTTLAVLVSILIAMDALSSLSCDPLVADFLVNVIGCICYATILVLVLTVGIGKKLKYFQVKAVIFFLLTFILIIISAVASFSNSDTKKRDNETDVEFCARARDQPMVYITYWYNAVIGLVSAFVHILTFRHVKKERKAPSSYAVPILGLILATLYAVILSVFFWTETCSVESRLLVVLACYPAIVTLYMMLWAILAQYCTKSLTSLTPPGVCEAPGSPHQYADEHFFMRILANFWEEDIVKAIKEVLVDPSQIKVSAKIGQGNFGEVFKGTMNGSPVALKAVQDRMNQTQVNAFVREGLQMKTFRHPNVMELHGICWSSNPTHARHHSPLIVLPYMELGDLKKYLRKCRPGVRSKQPLLEESNDTDISTQSASISTLQLVKFAHQIARGMEYIADKGIVHRDLATRNCMIDWDLKIKVADFGLARTMANGKDYYRMGQGGQLPIRWMAIESLLDFVFTTKSDVWSYGVTLWEVMTLAQLPYPGISNKEIVTLLRRGHRLQKPDECPQNM
jgi:hypothetical protein